MSAKTAFPIVRDVVNGEWREIPDIKSYNGNGAPGRFLEDLLGADAGGHDRPDLMDWEVKFTQHISLLTLVHKDPEPQNIIRDMVHSHGWLDKHGRMSFRHTFGGSSSKRGFYVKSELDRVVVRNNQKDAAVPHWTHNTLANAFGGKLRRLVVIFGEVKKNPRRVCYASATAFWELDILNISNFLESGLIKIDFDARTVGGPGSQIRNHGTKFGIKADSVGKLYQHRKIITNGKG